VDAAAFGTAGIFTIVTFGLFTKTGGKFSAALTLLTAMSVWLSATYIFDISWAFLLSLFCSISVYLTVAMIEKISAR
jgi:solute:Na+ symporter, SSS family